MQNKNIETNKNIWDGYAKSWTKEDVTTDHSLTEEEREKKINLLGDEWGDGESVQEVMEEFVYPFINKESIVAEIGSGGGRIASKSAPMVKELHCFDISEEMLKVLQNNLKDLKNIFYHPIEVPQDLLKSKKQFDFIYSFDVFVHFDLHMIWSYFVASKEVLKKGGKVFFHTGNLKSPKGWERFVNTDQFSVVNHYLIIPEIIQLFADKCGYRVIKESNPKESNFYYNRDYLFVMENLD